MLTEATGCRFDAPCTLAQHPQCDIIGAEWGFQQVHCPNLLFARSRYGIGSEFSNKNPWRSNRKIGIDGGSGRSNNAVRSRFGYLCRRSRSWRTGVCARARSPLTCPTPMSSATNCGRPSTQRTGSETAASARSITSPPFRRTEPRIPRKG